MKIYNKYDMEDFRNLEFSFKGGKGAAPTPPPVIAPTAPVEEASVEIDDDDENKRLRTGKSSLKMPLATATDTGLKV